MQREDYEHPEVQEQQVKYKPKPHQRISTKKPEEGEEHKLLACRTHTIEVFEDTGHDTM